MKKTSKRHRQQSRPLRGAAGATSSQRDWKIMFARWPSTEENIGVRKARIHFFRLLLSRLVDEREERERESIPSTSYSAAFSKGEMLDSKSPSSSRALAGISVAA